jgi:hypothetical protein
MTCTAKFALHFHQQDEASVYLEHTQTGETEGRTELLAQGHEPGGMRIVPYAGHSGLKRLVGSSVGEGFGWRPAPVISVAVRTQATAARSSASDGRWYSTIGRPNGKH